MMIILVELVIYPKFAGYLIISTRGTIVITPFFTIFLRFWHDRASNGGTQAQAPTDCTLHKVIAQLSR